MYSSEYIIRETKTLIDNAANNYCQVLNKKIMAAIIEGKTEVLAKITRSTMQDYLKHYYNDEKPLVQYITSEISTDILTRWVEQIVKNIKTARYSCEVEWTDMTDVRDKLGNMVVCQIKIEIPAVTWNND